MRMPLTAFLRDLEADARQRLLHGSLIREVPLNAAPAASHAWTEHDNLEVDEVVELDRAQRQGLVTSSSTDRQLASLLR